MTDYHTHILPGIDDGSKDINMTKTMLEMEHDMGVTHIYATPHFYSQQMAMDEFLENRSHSLQQVKALLETSPEFPQISVGAEIFYFEGIGKADNLEKLCVEGTDFFLLEMPFRQWNNKCIHDVEKLLVKQQLKVVLAHIERYYQFQKDRNAWNNILDMPVTLQMNANSFIKHVKSRKLCYKILDDYDDCILGSDCHNTTSRPPNLKYVKTIIENK